MVRPNKPDQYGLAANHDQSTACTHILLQTHKRKQQWSRNMGPVTSNAQRGGLAPLQTLEDTA